MHDLDLIITLTAGLAAAVTLGFVTHRLGLSPIVGYLLAGYAVGPHTPGPVANQEIAGQLAEVGVILLMFGVGLQFHIKELLDVRTIAIPGAIVQSLVATLLGCLLTRGFGWTWSAGVVFGLAISVASTVVLVRVLSDNHDLHTRTGRIAVGWLVVEDLFTVLVLVLLPTFAVQGDDHQPVILAIGFSLLKLATLVGFTFVIGGRAIPWLLSFVAATRSRELFTLTVLVLALGIAVGSAKLFGASIALGAFLAGMVVGRSEFSLRAASEALPMRDAFAVLFFVSVGMMFDPHYFVEAPGLIVGTLTVILIGKPLAALGIMLFRGYPTGVALGLASALAQIGEFSFILAVLAQQLGILPKGAMDALVAAAIVSILLNPLLYRAVEPFDRWACKRLSWWQRFNARIAPPSDSAAQPEAESEPKSVDRAVIVGYGPVGRTLARLLRDNGIEPTVIELNLDTVRALRAERMNAVYGDATREEILKAADVEKAVGFILSSAGMTGGQEVIRHVRELNPQIRIVARTNYLREGQALRQCGADVVFSGEGEVALAMTESLLRRLGATPDQIDRQRDRTREELFGLVEENPNTAR